MIQTHIVRTIVSVRI